MTDLTTSLLETLLCQQTLARTVSGTSRPLALLGMTVVLSALSVGTLTSQCLTSYPSIESFETDLGFWTQSTSDDYDWSRETGVSSTGATGPASAMNGMYYLQAESSLFPNGSAAVQTCLDLTSYCASEIEFNYHMQGADIGELRVEASVDNGANWTTIWVESGDQGASWYVKLLDLDSYLSYRSNIHFGRVLQSKILSQAHQILPEKKSTTPTLE